MVVFVVVGVDFENISLVFEADKVDRMVAQVAPPSSNADTAVAQIASGGGGGIVGGHRTPSSSSPPPPPPRFY